MELEVEMRDVGEEEGGEKRGGREENGGSIDEWRSRRSEMRYLLAYLHLSIQILRFPIFIMACIVLVWDGMG